MLFDWMSETMHVLLGLIPNSSKIEFDDMLFGLEYKWNDPILL